MIFAFVEDGTLEVYESTQAAISHYEGLDVESGVVRFYDESGTYLEPRFSEPNRRGKLLGVVGWGASGKYELVPDPSADEDSIALALYEASTLSPNPWFASMEQLKAALSDKGVEVEWPPEDST